MSWTAAGEIGLAQRRAGDRERVDRVGLPACPSSAAGAGHQLGRHPNHLLPGREQRSFQPGRDVPAVLDCPYPLARALPPGPHDQLLMPGIGRPHGAQRELAAGLIDHHGRVGVLVDVYPQHHHHGWRHLFLVLEGTAGSAGGHTSVGALPRSYQVTPVGPDHR